MFISLRNCVPCAVLSRTCVASALLSSNSVPGSASGGDRRDLPLLVSRSPVPPLQVIAFSSVSDKRLELSTLSYAYECMATRMERMRFFKSSCQQHFHVSVSGASSGPVPGRAGNPRNEGCRGGDGSLVRRYKIKEPWAP